MKEQSKPPHKVPRFAVNVSVYDNALKQQIVSAVFMTDHPWTVARSLKDAAATVNRLQAHDAPRYVRRHG